MITAHGFRGMASTLLHECGWSSGVIDRQLSQAERNAVKAAYNHAVHLPARRKMMWAWAGDLNSLRNGAEIISLRAQAGICGLKPATAFCHRVSSHQLPPTPC